MPAPCQSPIRPGNPDASLFLRPPVDDAGTKPGAGRDTDARGGCADSVSPPRADCADELDPHSPGSNSADPDHTTNTGTPLGDKGRKPVDGNRGEALVPQHNGLDIRPKTQDTDPGRGETPGAGRGTYRKSE